MAKILPVFFESPEAYVKYAIEGREGLGPKLEDWDERDRPFMFARHVLTVRADNVERLKRVYDTRDFGSWAQRLDADCGSIAADALFEKKFMYANRLTEGDMPDVGRYLDGMERMWSGVRRRNRRRRTVRIYINFVGASATGKLAASLAELLESDGIGTEIHAVAGTSVKCYRRDEQGRPSREGTNLILVEDVMLKRVEDYADLGRIGYTCGNDDVFGSLEFSTECTALWRNGWDQWDIGSVHDVSWKDLGLSEDEARTSFIIPCHSDSRWAMSKLGNIIRASSGDDAEYDDGGFDE